MENVTSWLIYLLIANIIGFYLMLKDKQKAKQHAYRIPERTFWLLAILGGSIGVYIGMQAFRHKTKHISFTIGMPFLILVNLVCFTGFIFFSEEITHFLTEIM
ncbi:DUF1294 domain-containing protein [Oceanobacillus locisalsi]|uniref:DUF1294 domain-containing protein n=1 Tax=Oceanobacillus locisalsi TaxID=546107 RepID=A0ABW3NL39_9BACI